MEAGCIFCAIAGGEAPATVIEEDEHTLAFMDIQPWARGHALVIPRRHALDLRTIDAQDLERVFAMAQRVAGRMKERLATEDVTLFHSSGATAGQQVMHFHLHVVPAALPQEFAREQPSPATQELEATAERLRGT
jgi:histidine triad (HIT) family protein